MRMGIGLGLGFTRFTGSGGTFDPLTIASLWGWWDPSDAAKRTEGGGGTTITALADKSGNGRNCTSLGNDPGKGSGINALVTLSFTAGGAAALNLPNTLNTLTAAEVHVVCKADAQTPAAGRGLWYAGTAGDTYHPFTNGNVYDSFGSNAWRASNVNAGDMSAAHTWNVISTATEWTANKNGAQITTTGTNTVAFPASPWLGRSLSATGFAGHIGELLIFNAKLSTTDRNNVQAYLKAKWGTP